MMEGGFRPPVERFRGLPGRLGGVSLAAPLGIYTQPLLHARAAKQARLPSPRHSQV